MLVKNNGHIALELVYDFQFCKLYDEKVEAYNNLSNKMEEAGVDHNHLVTLVKAIERLENYKLKFLNRKLK